MVRFLSNQYRIQFTHEYAWYICIGSNILFLFFFFTQHNLWGSMKKNCLCVVSLTEPIKQASISLLLRVCFLFTLLNRQELNLNISYFASSFLFVKLFCMFDLLAAVPCTDDCRLENVLLCSKESVIWLVNVLLFRKMLYSCAVLFPFWKRKTSNLSWNFFS